MLLLLIYYFVPFLNNASKKVMAATMGPFPLQPLA